MDRLKVCQKPRMLLDMGAKVTKRCGKLASTSQSLLTIQID